MLLRSQPSKERIRQFLAAQGDVTFSYPQVGATRTIPPPGYAVDHNRIRLGEGSETFARAIGALRSWEMFHLGWVELCWPDAAICPGSTVAIVSHQLGFWTLNAARIVYLIEEEGAVRKHGFAYGTLPDHVESGEERFTVEWHRDDDSVWYDLLAFSCPNHRFAAIAYPVSRALQKRFARDSKRAMLRKAQPDAHSHHPGL